MLYGKYDVIKNNDPTVFSKLYLRSCLKMTYLGTIFSSKIGSFVESGILVDQNHNDKIAAQRLSLDAFLPYTNLSKTWNWFSLVNQMLSKHTPLGWHLSVSQRLSESLIKALKTEESSIAGKMQDFRHVWELYGVFMIVVILVYLVEICLKDLNSYFFVKSFEQISQSPRRHKYV